MNERRRHRKCWRPSPAFEWVMVPLAALVLMLLSTCSHAAGAELRRAPVVNEAGQQTGWFTYEKQEDALVFFCVQREEKKAITCAVWLFGSSGSGVVTLELTPSETKS